MHRVLILGAGKIGSAIARFLTGTGEYDVVLADVDAPAIERLRGNPALSRARLIQLDVTDASALIAAMRDRQSVISALIYSLNPAVAAACLEAGCSYFDLTEDVATTRAVKEIATRAGARQIFMPQCGLAPGFVSIAAMHLTQMFDRLDEVKMRVGALPVFPTNSLKYNLTWSTDGLINEYCNPCEAIHDGRKIELLPLEGTERFSLDGIDYEAFNTSGGLGTLADTLDGRLRTLNYKTVRYPGHRDLIAFLTRDLRLSERRELLKDVLENAVPITLQDIVLVFVTVTGWREGRLTQLTDARKVYADVVDGQPWSAIQITTAAGICAVVDLHAAGAIKGNGFIRQEQVSLTEFLSNRFGKRYASAK